MTTLSLRRRAIGFAIAALGVVLLCAWLLFSRGTAPIQTDLLAMLPATERHPMAEAAVEQLARANGDRIVLLVEDADDATAKGAARALGQALEQSKAFGTVTATLPPFDLDRLLAPYLTHRFYLLSEADRAALSAPGYDPAQVLARRLNEPFLAGVGLKLEDDPFGWLQHWLEQQPWSRSPLLPEDDLLVAHDDDRTYVLVTAELRGSSYDDAVQRPTLAALDAAENTLHKSYPSVRMSRAGALFYAASARADAERDMHMVGLISTLGIALLLLAIFRSPGPLLLAFLSTAIGVVSALTLTLLLFGQIHLLTLVFGAALLGEAVDYSIQYLAARANTGNDWDAARGARQVRPALWLALGTSLLGYALLGLMPFPALRQMAVFAMAGMLAACLSVFWLLPALLQKPSRPLAPSATATALGLQKLAARAGWPAFVLLALIALPGIWRLGHDDDIHLLISPPTDVVAQEQHIRQITGLGNGTQFYLVHGASVEETLQRAEALDARLQALTERGQLQSWLSISTMLPLQARQQAGHDALAPLFASPDRLKAQLQQAGFRADAAARYVDAWPGRPLNLAEWLKLPLSTPFRYLWMDGGKDGYGALVVPQGQDDSSRLRAAAQGLPGVELIDKPASVSELFGRYRHYASLWLLAALILIVPVFGWRYGWRAMPRVVA
ncbi:MAG TPA: MMPL family transporter, partial [Dyella sp.]|uniref:MMPL family transporter n=1 Tax=Dyella sp. TaxID=1869338 RepID=UPI002F921D97